MNRISQIAGEIFRTGKRPLHDYGDDFSTADAYTSNAILMFSWLVEGYLCIYYIHPELIMAGLVKFK